MPAGDPGAAEAPGPGVVLSEYEARVLRRLRAAAGPLREAEVGDGTGLAADTVRGSLQRLRSKHLVLVTERHDERLTLTERGQDARARRLPERRLLERLRAGPVAPSDLGGLALSDDERSAAIGRLRRAGWLAPGVPLSLRPTAPRPDDPLPEEALLDAVAAGDADAVDRALVPAAERRGLVARERRTERSWSVAPEGAEFPLDEGGALLGALTPALLRDGGWRDAAFRPYDVRADVPLVTGARPHPYAAWLREFEEVLLGLGFEQAEGPLLETEFWNADVLFMPQDHPARSIHDVLAVRGVAGRPPDPELLARVAAVHEGRALPGDARPLTPGWGAPYDPGVAARPVLRSQTTAVSARFLAARPRPPFRMFSLDRNFRREALDAAHHVEFGQCEGILAQEGVSLRHLIGVFEALAEAIGIRQLRIRPSYFPFTEPSVEGYVKHPRLGWMEVFPGGLFRPEVLRPLGVDGPVAAWGIGSTRLAMVALGVNDIRELYDDDLARLTGGG